MNVINEWEEMYQTGGLTPEVIVQHLRNIAGTFILPVGADQPQLPDQQQQEQQQQEQQNVPDPDAQGGNNGFLSGNYVYSDTMARAATIAVMELFICGPNPDNYLEQIRQADTVSSVCGRVFKIGEPTYSCRECSMDPTCVLCSTCFKKSEHRNHKYKMATSGGGGCCDCGDEEAWKKYPFCEEHAVCITDQTQASQQQQAPLPEERKMRCEIVFRAILNYSMQMLQMHGTGNCPELEDDENTHCTILYNDETHTFEQVIQTLTSIVKCEHKTAIEYVTSIDREGRAVVKCASFEVCKKLKEDIENKAMRSTLTTRAMPLKVTVMHRNEVACQHLAMQLLVWLQEFLTKNSTFRSVFAETISKPQVTYNLKFILSNDHNLWKSARACWHRLLISGMLMEYENKKLLATTFTKLYTSLMQDFIRDDHYHSFSIVSLSVQLFTVPTIAHYLIENESAFFKLMHTYFSETIDKYVKNRQLVFIKNTSTMNSFKRAAYILIDLKYLLSFKPEKWTPELRVGFLHGMQQLIRLLKYMQGMDAATRQVGQHLEYEQEWETAFTLHLKLSHLITLVLEWCATDRMVLLKVLRMVITALTETKFIALESETVVCEAANHSASCLTYDVLTRPVSVHLPLTRFLAGLYTVFERHDFTFDKVSQNLPDRPTPEQIIEPVLCARTMMSQVQAGMWRRNGYALINQLFFYRNVKCRYEMLDRDIVILQMGASLIEANEFIIHVLNKYKLLGWLEQDVPERQRAVDAGSGSDEDHMRQAGILVEEFLELLIVIIGERYVPGVGDVTESDRIKKEIVQQLCIKPHSHSELSRALNEDSCSEIMFESVIDEVAVFEKPNSAEKRGVYILKPEYNSWYNLYFYHYSKEDKSRSEERQRLQKKEKNELVCCPPPTLPKLTQIFSTIPTLLQCDVMLKVMHVVMTRALDLRSVSFTEGQLQRVLHLIGYALQEEESGHYPYMFLRPKPNDRAAADAGGALQPSKGGIAAGSAALGNSALQSDGGEAHQLDPERDRSGRVERQRAGDGRPGPPREGAAGEAGGVAPGPADGADEAGAANVHDHQPGHVQHRERRFVRAGPDGAGAERRHGLADDERAPGRARPEPYAGQAGRHGRPAPLVHPLLGKVRPRHVPLGQHGVRRVRAAVERAVPLPADGRAGPAAADRDEDAPVAAPDHLRARDAHDLLRQVLQQRGDQGEPAPVPEPGPDPVRHREERVPVPAVPLPEQLSAAAGAAARNDHEQREGAHERVGAGGRRPRLAARSADNAAERVHLPAVVRVHAGHGGKHGAPRGASHTAAWLVRRRHAQGACDPRHAAGCADQALPGGGTAADEP
uniref:E3 ubiquitin-protein ligase n=1 Tax=Anopheles coluzzii TaxID=1518534 RepID=A0A6E8V8A1_ANOCL